ncbi:MAG: PQQ-dependent sugar dehydrogenase [Bacteroidota bacterium]
MNLGLAKILLSLLAFGSLLSCVEKNIWVYDSPFPISEDHFTMDTLAQDLVIPYGIAILGDDEYFLTDRVGKMYHYQGGEMIEISGMPEVVTFGIDGIPAILHGGLMDISLHPDYRSNGWIYISYLEPQGLNKVSRFKIKQNSATAFETIFATRFQNYSGNGMRIVWQDSTHFFLNLGNSDLSTAANPIMYAQELDKAMGKIHRLKDDGSIPPDNPILGDRSEPSSIWSYGHRDVQGLVYDSSTQSLFGVEHGPKGGDEFNLIEKGQNYGWPLFSYGINYDGQWVSLISEDSAASFTRFPEHYWTVPTPDGGQAIGPACLLKVDSSNVADWNGYFVFGSLAYRRLMKYDRETDETFGLKVEGRVRTIKQLPSGDLIALIERNHLDKANGLLVRISP